MKLLCRIAVTALLTVSSPALTRAELQVEKRQSDDGELTVFKMTVTPAAEPVPALKHRLLLREIDEKPGNAATMYYRALMASEELGSQFRAKFGQEYPDEYPWTDTPNAQDKTRAAAEIVGSSPVLDHLREATARRDCDWGFQLEAIRGSELYSFLLPELTESRQLSRHLTLLARLAIHERRYDDALDALRMNFKLSRDVAAEPLLIGGLVGMSAAGVGNRAVIDLIAAPDSPNLYWALTELPDPLIDLRAAVRFEMSSIERVFPFLRDAEAQEHSPDEWARLLAGAATEATALGGARPQIEGLTARAAVTGVSLLSYPSAKQRLLAGGMDAARVERMPVGQVLAIDAAREFRRIADEFEKWWYVPYPVARKHYNGADAEFDGNKFAKGFGHIMASLLLPAVSATRDAQERMGWQLGGLRTLEAIRMHAAATGELPRSLEDVKVVPVPINPMTGRPYEYRLQGDAAVLELPFSDGFPNLAWRFEIKLAQ